MKFSLIALAVLTLASGATVSEGASFSVEKPEADDLIAAGKARLAGDPSKEEPKAKTTKVRLLVDCAHGKCNDVVALSAADLKAAEAANLVDASKAAVDYAMTLPQNQPKPKG